MKETIEEVAKKYVDASNFDCWKDQLRECFIAGSKYQQKLTPHSEEDIKKAFYQGMASMQLFKDTGSGFVSLVEFLKTLNK